MEVQFKFELGDVLKHVGHEALSGQQRVTERRCILVVVERGTQECSGGIQKFYDCRAAIDDGLSGGPATTDRLVRYHEVELTKF